VTPCINTVGQDDVRCGICVKDCGEAQPEVCNYFGVAIDECKTSAAGGGGANPACGTGTICCAPFQPAIEPDNGVCPVPILGKKIAPQVKKASRKP